jgi:transcriptional regulator GlxA family with amidase domain
MSLLPSGGAGIVMGMARHVVMLGYPDAQLLDIVGPLEVFSRAARLFTEEGRRGELPYSVELVGLTRGRLIASSGLELNCARAFADVRGGVDTLMISGGRGMPAALGNAALIAWLRRMAGRVRRLAAVCTGSFLLAEAQLLDGKRATTHWGACARMAERYPRVTVDPDPIFIRQGSIYTSAGVTAGMDLALALVEEDHGARLARQVARELVMFLQRPGGQAQFSTQLEASLDDGAPLAELLAWMADNPGADLSVARLAQRVAMSERNFARVFRRHTGVTPARFVARLRVEAARRRLEQCAQSGAKVDAIAAACGFGSAESMRRAFQRILRVAPTAYRSRFATRPH